MGYKFKGFFVGILFLVVFTLLFAMMNEKLIENITGTNCSYSCSLNSLIVTYQSPWFLVFFGVFWFLGALIMKLGELINEKSRIGLPKNYSNKKDEFKWPWEHKLSIIEDKD